MSYNIEDFWLSYPLWDYIRHYKKLRGIHEIIPLLNLIPATRNQFSNINLTQKIGPKQVEISLSSQLISRHYHPTNYRSVSTDS